MRQGKHPVPLRQTQERVPIHLLRQPREGERTNVPETVRSRLRSAHAENARHALLLAGELRRLMGALQAAGVSALAYKGPALAVRAYGHLALRTYSDLDLLVAPSSVPVSYTHLTLPTILLV